MMWNIISLAHCSKVQGLCVCTQAHVHELSPFIVTAPTKDFTNMNTNSPHTELGVTFTWGSGAGFRSCCFARCLSIFLRGFRYNHKWQQQRQWQGVPTEQQSLRTSGVMVRNTWGGRGKRVEAGKGGVMWYSGCIAPVEGKYTCKRFGGGSKSLDWGCFSLESNYIPVKSFTGMMLPVEVSTRDLLLMTLQNLVSSCVNSNAWIAKRECASFPKRSCWICVLRGKQCVGHRTGQREP